MSLNRLLSAIKEDFVARTDPEVVRMMEITRQELVDAGLHEQALAEGEKMPDFVLRDTTGMDFSSRSALKQGPLVINWYRGIW